MKRILTVLFLTFCAFLVFATPSLAFDADSFFDEYEEIHPDGAFDPERVGDETDAAEIFRMVGDAFSDGLPGAVSFFAMLVGIAAVYAASESFTERISEGSARLTSSAISAISSTLIISRLLPLALSVRTGMQEMSAFFSGLLPIATGILAAGGSVNSAATQAFNMSLTLGVIEYAATELLMPLVFAMLALSVTAGLGAGTVSTLARWIKSVFAWLLGIFTTVIIGSVSMQSMISAAKDSAYLRGAKYAASGMIPVVGGVVSGALSSLAGGLAYVKSVIGVSAVFVIVSIALTPLITLLLYRVSLSLAGSLIELLSGDGGGGCFRSFRSALDALIAVYSLTALCAIFEIFVFMKSGVEILG